MAQTSATIQPITVQPVKRFSTKMAEAWRWRTKQMISVRGNGAGSPRTAR
jgi:hypothetical protein